MSRVAPIFEDYQERYENIRLQRTAGLLEVTLHTEGGSLVWTTQSHDELAYCFADIAADPENEVVILTGSGDAFCDDIDVTTFVVSSAQDWSQVVFEGGQLLTNLLRIRVPVIAAVNGPVTIHAEIPVLSDLVVASDTAVFSDRPHFPRGVVPGDGVHVVWTHVLGPNRGRYFLLTGQELSAAQALELGVVSEVVSADRVLARARQLAGLIADQPVLARRYARSVLTREIKRLMFDHLEYGLVHQALAGLDVTSAGGVPNA